MYVFEPQHIVENEWWRVISLSQGDYLTRTETGHHDRQTARKVLSQYVPVGFVRSSSADQVVAAGNVSAENMISLTELAALIAEAQQRDAEERERAQEKWQVLRRQQFDRVLAAPDADEPITEGRWQGFTKGEALAWCHNLFDYEPHGFTHPANEVRTRAFQKLVEGEPATVFAYPERAREHVARGLTAEQYRRMKEQLGEKLFR